MKRTGEIIAALLAALLAGAVWLDAHDTRVRERALLAERAKAKDAEVARMDSANARFRIALARAEAHTDTVKVRVEQKVAAFDTLRAEIDTSAAQPEGVPEGYVIVPVAFVRAADSLAASIPQMLEAHNAERIAAVQRIASADSTITLLKSEVSLLKRIADANKPKWSDKLKHGVVGGMVVATVFAAVHR